MLPSRSRHARSPAPPGTYCPSGSPFSVAVPPAKLMERTSPPSSSRSREAAFDEISILLETISACCAEAPDPHSSRIQPAPAASRPRFEGRAWRLLYRRTATIQSGVGHQVLVEDSCGNQCKSAKDREPEEQGRHERASQSPASQRPELACPAAEQPIRRTRNCTHTPC